MEHNLFSSLRRRVALSGGKAAIAQILLTNVFILVINFGTGMITARFLGPDGRGEQAAILVWIQALPYAISLGLPSAVLYNLRRYPDRASQIFLAALPLGTLMGGIAAVVGVVLIPLWLTEYPPEVARFTQSAILAAPIILLSLAFAFVLQAREEFALYNAVRYLGPMLTLLALGLLLLTPDGLTPFNSALAYLLPAIPIFLWMLIRLWRIYRPTRRGLGWATKRLVSYGTRAYGGDLVGQLSLYLDRLLVVGLLSPTAMGLYVVAISLSQTLHVVQAAVISVLFPKASGRSVEEAASLAGRAVRASTTVTALAAIGLAVIAPWALWLFYGQEFFAATSVFRLLLLEVVLVGITWVLLQAFMAVDRPGMVTVLQALSLGISVPLLLVLVPRYGLEGAGLALVISRAIGLAFTLVSFPLVLKVRVPQLWPARSDLASIAAILRGEKESPR